MHAFSGVAKTDKPKLSLVSSEPMTDAIRGITPRTMRLYNYDACTYKRNPAHAANYLNQDGLTVAQHIRYGNKQFAWTGDSSAVKLFGQHLGSEGTVIITEGEFDAMSIYECVHKYHPKRKVVVVSVPNGAARAKKDVKHNLKWLLAFNRRILFLDQDTPGKKAAAELLAMCGPRTAVVQRFPYKDANEAWVQGDHQSILEGIDNAQEHRPEAIVHAPDLLPQILNPEHRVGLQFPWSGWNGLTDGMQPGQLIMISAGTGLGKSLVTRSIARSLACDGTKVAYIGLEESCATTVDRMLSEQMGEPFHLDTVEQRKRRDEAKIKEHLDQFAPNLFLLDKFGSDDFDQFVANVKHYVLGEECKVIILDHFSLLADGIALDTDQRRAIDRCIKDLKTLAVELNFTMLVVCHLSRSNSMGPSHEEGGEPTLSELRGSHSLAQIPDHVIMLQRNPKAEGKLEQNTTYCYLKKNRVKGEVGLMSKLIFDPDTCKISEDR